MQRLKIEPDEIVSVHHLALDGTKYIIRTIENNGTESIFIEEPYDYSIKKKKKEKEQREIHPPYTGGKEL